MSDGDFGEGGLRQRGYQDDARRGVPIRHDTHSR